MIKLQKYDIIEANIPVASGSVQQGKKHRPYVIVSNDLGTQTAPIIIVMPLTHIIKSLHLPVHGCLEAKTETGLDSYSMILGEQPQTICKKEVMYKRGKIINQRDKDMINRVCYNSFFWGEKINWEEVLRDDRKNRGEGKDKEIIVKNGSKRLCGCG